MEIEPTRVSGVLLVKPKVFGDSRGYFLETWQKERYEEAGITLPFVQDNHSRSTHGVLRGMHYQKARPQGKLVSVSLGSVYDVACDIRRDSPTYGSWFGVELSQDNQWQLWVPPGLAHGFVVTSKVAHFHYKCTDYWCPWDEASFRFDDPFFNVAWPVDMPLLSDKDRNAPYWKDQC